MERYPKITEIKKTITPDEGELLVELARTRNGITTGLRRNEQGEYEVYYPEKEANTLSAKPSTATK